MRVGEGGDPGGEQGQKGGQDGTQGDEGPDLFRAFEAVPFQEGG